MLAGVSVTWYTWLEQGRPINASVDVLSALARAMRLDDAGRQHLLTLALRTPLEPIETVEHAPDALVRLITSMEPAPAYVLGPRWDFLAWNRPQSLLYPLIDRLAPEDRNLLWVVFAEPNARRLNQEPRANAGGLAIYTGVVAAIILAGCLSPIVLAKVQVAILAILLGGSVLVIVGFIDDQFGGLPPLFRIIVQILAALLLVVCKIQIHIVYFGAPIDGILSILVTVFWIVGITNAVNLMDGMDNIS